ncbi:hypothetical protein [Synechococcus sp. M16CYN]|uniref:hypothetical protein n=1 Tax=Synechococcus sp. M16CYN TaxID=3103139 RepID=UPI003342702C
MLKGTRRGSGIDGFFGITNSVQIAAKLASIAANRASSAVKAGRRKTGALRE